MSTKIFAFLRRAESVTPSYFRQHWLQVHAPLARELGFDRYEQFHALDGAVTPFSDAGFDGVSEVWYPSASLTASTRDSSYYADHILTDEKNFIADDGVALLATESVRADPPPADGLQLKAMLLTRRRDGASDEEFADFCSSELPKLARDRIPAVVGFDVSSAHEIPQSWRGERPERLPVYDAVIELWWDWTSRSDSDSLDLTTFASAMADTALDPTQISSLVGYTLPIVTSELTTAP